MSRWTIVASLAALSLLLLTCPAPSCTLCQNVQLSQTFRQEAAGESAKLILYGTLANPQVKSNGTATTEFHIKTIVRNHAILAGQRRIVLQRFLPVSDPKNPPRFLVFCDVFKNSLDPYRGVPVKDESAIDYLQKALALRPKNRVDELLFYFPYMEHADPEVSRDAFLEFAKASDQDVGRVAPRLPAAKLRAWISDPKTPAERLGLYAFLLGGCGAEQDATFLRTLLQDSSERTVNAFDGILSGYIHLRPTEGWALAHAVLADGKKPLQVRLAAVRTLRFYQALQARENRANILKGHAVVLSQGELADLAIEELRKSQTWDLTRAVLACYGRKGYDAPLVQRAIVRYALSCNDEPSRRFLAEVRAKDAEMVKDIEESLRFEKPK